MGWPVYVLEPVLQDWKKLPKFMSRSSIDKYLGYHPLVSNLHTGNIIPQFHLVFDDYFETLHAGKDQETPVWSELVTF